MAGTMLFNVFFGIAGFAIVFLLSFSANTFTTTIVRSAVAFSVFFLSGYMFRWMLGYIQKDSVEKAPKPSHNINIHNETELQQLMEGLTEEEAQKVAAYIRHMLQQGNDDS
jgi:cell division protein YceG involved in septum cleavage